MEPSELEVRYKALRDALIANLRLQERLQETLTLVENGITRNAEMQAKVQVHAMRINRSGWYTGLKLVDFPSVGSFGPRAGGPSRFWMVAGSVPEPNEDTRKLLPAYQYLPHTFPTRKWSRDEDENLNRLVLHTLQAAKHAEFNNAASGQNLRLMPEDLAARLGEIGALTLQSPGMEEAAMVLDGSIWTLIATQHASSRLGAECMTRWINHLRPSLQQVPDTGEAGEWTGKEDSRMLQVAEKHGFRNWPKIAEEIGSGRTAVACLARYREQKASMAARPWTEEEKRQLSISYAKHAGKGSFWKTVALDLPGRTHAQCMQYWRNNMDSSIKKGKWSAEEDEALIKAVKAFGRKWARVAEAVPARNQVQVRERFVNVLDPDLKKGHPWTKEEDAILLEAVQDPQCKNRDGTLRWADIARRLPGRTDDAVSNHASALKRYAARKRERAHKSSKLQPNDQTQKLQPNDQTQKQQRT